MKIFWFCTTLALLPRFTFGSGDLRRDGARGLQTLNGRVCHFPPPPPDVLESTVVELSYYPPTTDESNPNFIIVNVDDSQVPDLYFKFKACPGGNTFTFDSCDNPPVNDTLVPPIYDTYMSVWTRDELDFNLEKCIDRQELHVDCRWQEIITVDSEYYGQELFFKITLRNRNPPDYVRTGEIKFFYKVDDGNWPCFPSVTADYVKGSAEVHFQQQNSTTIPNIKLDFMYSGLFGTANFMRFGRPRFDAKVFEVDCKQGNEITDPFTVEVLDAIGQENGITFVVHQNDYTVGLYSNYGSWASPFWTEDNGVGTLKICVQFQVNNNEPLEPDDDILLEFVDVALEITVNLTQADDCVVNEETFDPDDCFGEVILIRDQVIIVNDTVDVDFPIVIGPCEWKNDTDGNFGPQPKTTVTQGEPFSVCTWFNHTPEGVCMTDIVELYFTVPPLPGSTDPMLVYKVIPNGQLFYGPVECLYKATTRRQLQPTADPDNHHCNVDVLPPAALIDKLTQGWLNPDGTSNITDSYTGYLSGKVWIGFGQYCSFPTRLRRRMLKLPTTKVVDIQGSMEFQIAPTEVTVNEKECKTVRCRIRNRLAKLLSLFKRRN